MLKLKRITTVILTLAIIAVSVIAFTACGEDETKFGGNDTMTLVLAPSEGNEKETTVQLNGLSRDCNLIDVFDAISLDYTLSGTMLTKVGDLEQVDSEGKYLYLYTSVVADYDVSAYATTVEYKGNTLTNSGVGATEMTIENGCTIYIGYIIWA